MGLFGRRRDNSESSADTAESLAEPGTDLADEITTAALGAQEEEHLNRARAAYRQHAIDPTDLASISAAYDAGIRTGDTDLIGVLATAIGDHLCERAGYRWVLVTDTFGTDLGLLGPRRRATSMPHTLVAVRWMRGETGWVAGVVEHLAQQGNPRD